MRVILGGLYNSGSTCLAGCLYRLGVDMGSPFWRDTANNHYEPYDLSCLVRHFWNEPFARAITPEPIRIQIFRNWVLGRESLGSTAVGAKHPLLALSLQDFLVAWGPNTKFLWSYRALEESIAKLQKRGWFGDNAEHLQQQLWDSLEKFYESHHPDMLKVDFYRLRTNREQELAEICKFLAIEPTPAQLQNALNWVVRE